MGEERAELAAELRSELHRAAARDDLAERMLEVAAVVEEAAAPFGIQPVVVGGVAVYLWTASDAFLTHDIDVVMQVPPQLSAPSSHSSASSPRPTVAIGASKAPTYCWKRPARSWTRTPL